MTIDDTIFCPICCSTSAASQERLHEIARLSLARLLNVARRARVNITPEQQRAILEALLTWDNCGLPDEVDWLVHEQFIRAVYYLDGCPDADPRLVALAMSMPPWDANSGDSLHWESRYGWQTFNNVGAVS